MALIITAKWPCHCSQFLVAVHIPMTHFSDFLQSPDCQQNLQITIIRQIRRIAGSQWISSPRLLLTFSFLVELVWNLKNFHFYFLAEFRWVHQQLRGLLLFERTLGREGSTPGHLPPTHAGCEDHSSGRSRDLEGVRGLPPDRTTWEALGWKESLDKYRPDSGAGEKNLSGSEPMTLNLKLALDHCFLILRFFLIWS